MLFLEKVVTYCMSMPSVTVPQAEMFEAVIVDMPDINSQLYFALILRNGWSVHLVQVSTPLTFQLSFSIIGTIF